MNTIEEATPDMTGSIIEWNGERLAVWNPCRDDAFASASEREGLRARKLLSHSYVSWISVLVHLPDMAVGRFSIASSKLSPGNVRDWAQQTYLVPANASHIPLGGKPREALLGSGVLLPATVPVDYISLTSLVRDIASCTSTSYTVFQKSQESLTDF